MGYLLGSMFEEDKEALSSELSKYEDDKPIFGSGASTFGSGASNFKGLAQETTAKLTGTDVSKLKGFDVINIKKH